MRLLTPLLLALALLTAGAAVAAPAIETARTAHTRATQSLERIESERVALDRAHEALAAEIEGLKAAADTPLLPGVRDPRLDDRLKKARSLAESLAALDRRAGDARDAVETSRRALLAALDAELIARRAALADAPALERRARFENLRGLIAERQALARPAPRTPDPALPETPDDPMASPDELRELADESRDHAEQVQDRLGMLETQLARLRERQRLVRAATAFSRDDALFAQDERNRQLVRREDGLPTVTAEAGDRPNRTPSEQTDGDRLGNVDNAAGDAADPEATPEADDAADAPPAAGDGDEGGFEADGDNDGFQGEPGREELPPDEMVDGPALADDIAPEGVPVGVDGDGIGEAGSVVLQDAFDPTLLEDLDDLSPDALARRIAAMEARRKALEKTRAELKSRGEALERRADALENE